MDQIPSPATVRPASEIIQSIQKLDTNEREEALLDALLEGRVPGYMREFVDIELTFSDKNRVGHKLTIRTFPDYLTLGTEQDRLRTPLWPLTAQKVADAWNCVLPTRKLVTLLWHASQQKLEPSPWGPPYDASMYGTKRFVDHNARVEKTIAEKGFDCSRLIVGHKKDVVITNQLTQKPKQVAIFGWHKHDGKNIQGLYLGHENTYSDYSHGIRLLSRWCTIDDTVYDLIDVMQDPILHVAVSDEGPMQVIRQPLV